jgi:uncharacterized oxidoreductase
MGISGVNDEPNGKTRCFITGGGSGIGRGFAETLHGKGKKVIISGRRKSALEEVGRANPGIEFVELDIENPKSRNK